MFLLSLHGKKLIALAIVFGAAILFLSFYSPILAQDAGVGDGGDTGSSEVVLPPTPPTSDLGAGAGGDGGTGGSGGDTGSGGDGGVAGNNNDGGDGGGAGDGAGNGGNGGDAGSGNPGGTGGDGGPGGDTGAGGDGGAGDGTGSGGEGASGGIDAGEGGNGGTGGAGSDGGGNQNGGDSGDGGAGADGGNTGPGGKGGNGGGADDGQEDAGRGTSAVVTGDAISSTNIINVVNANILNSEGFLLFLNALLGGFTLDLRDHEALAALSGTGGVFCSLGSCPNQAGQTSVGATSTATITNSAIVRAISGQNTVDNPHGDGIVLSGDAYAGANVINVANTNLINSNYLLVSFNNFGSLLGDIVFPGKDFFAEFIRGMAGSLVQNLNMTHINTADVLNNVDADALSGDNQATSTNGLAAVGTGDSRAGANIVNQVNSNFINEDSFLIVIRVHGNWTGNIFGLPEGISWAETPNGIELLMTPADETASSTDGGGAYGLLNSLGAGSRLTVHGTSTASILNNIQVFALTGENKVNAVGDALIGTGNAYAGANIINVANTNVIGRNWVLAIFNIFGDWSGNLAFGRPNLWLGGAASGETFAPGSSVTYTFTITNFGDSDATNVRLRNIFDRRLLHLSGEELEDGSGVEWTVGTVPAGGTVEVSYTGTIDDGLPFGQTVIGTETTVTSFETDDDTTDNTELLTVVAVREQQGDLGGGPRVVYTPDPNFTITKTSSASTTMIVPPTTVDYTITVKNTGGSAYHAVLTDELTNEAGDVIHEEEWDLGEILPDEEITVTYTVAFSAGMPSGTYTNSAQVHAIGRHPSTNPLYGAIVESTIARAAIGVMHPPLPPEPGVPEEPEEPLLLVEASVLSVPTPLIPRAEAYEEEQGLPGASPAPTAAAGYSEENLLGAAILGLPDALSEFLSSPRCIIEFLVILSLVGAAIYLLERVMTASAGKEKRRRRILFAGIGVATALLGAFVIGETCLLLPLGFVLLVLLFLLGTFEFGRGGNI